MKKTFIERSIRKYWPKDPTKEQGKLVHSVYGKPVALSMCSFFHSSSFLFGKTYIMNLVFNKLK